DPVNAVWKLHQLAGPGLIETVDSGDTVTAGKDRTGLADLELLLVFLDLLADDVADLRRTDLHCRVPSGRRLRAALGHLLAEANQLRLQTPVVDGAPDVEDDAAEQLGIDLRGRDHLATFRQTTR